MPHSGFKRTVSDCTSVHCSALPCNAYVHAMVVLLSRFLVLSSCAPPLAPLVYRLVSPWCTSGVPQVGLLAEADAMGWDPATILSLVGAGDPALTSYALQDSYGSYALYALYALVCFVGSV